MFALPDSIKIGACALSMMVCVPAFQDVQAADNLNCSGSTPAPSMEKNQGPQSQARSTTADTE